MEENVNDHNSTEYASFSQFFSVYVMGLILNDGVKKSNLNLIVSDGFLMINLTIVAVVCTIIAYYLAVSVASQSGYEIRKRLYDTYSALPVKEANKFNSTGLMSRSTRGVYTIRAFIYNVLAYAIVVPFFTIYLFIEFEDINTMLIIIFLVLTAILIIYLCITLYYAFNGYFTVKKNIRKHKLQVQTGSITFKQCQIQY